jgi:hypothetical protein
MREISDRSANRTPLRAPAASQPSIIEPSELRPRSSNPPANESDGGDSPDERTWPSIPPDAIVPGATSSEEVAVAPSAAPDSALVPRLGRVAINAPDSSSAASQPKVAHTAAPTDSAFVSPFSISVPTPPIPLVAHAPPRPARAPAPARVDDRASRSNRLSRWLFVLLAFAFFGAAVWAAWRSGGTDALAP